MFRKLEINIPFAEALDQMPHCDKFMKEIINKKRKRDENGIVSLFSNCSAIIKKNLPQKKCKILEALLYPSQLEILNLESTL